MDFSGFFLNLCLSLTMCSIFLNSSIHSFFVEHQKEKKKSWCDSFDSSSRHFTLFGLKQWQLTCLPTPQPSDVVIQVQNTEIYLLFGAQDHYCSPMAPTNCTSVTLLSPQLLAIGSRTGKWVAPVTLKAENGQP